MTFVNDNNSVLEFDGNFALTKQACSLFNFKIQGDVSISFTVENNSVNREVLGYYGPMMLNNVAQTRQRFNAMKDGNKIARGYIIIERDNGGTLDCYFLSGNGNWFNQLQSKVTEYDYIGYIVLMSDVDSRKASTSGIAFPIVDWGCDGQKLGKDFLNSNALVGQNEIGYQEMAPCFYFTSLIQEISKNTGVKFAGTVFSEQTYKSMLMTGKGPKLEYPTKGITETFVSLKRSANVVMTTTLQNLPFDSIIDQGIKLNYNATTYRYTAERSATFKVTLNIKYTGGPITGGFIYVNGVSYKSLGIVNTSPIVKLMYVNMVAGDYMEIKTSSAVGYTFLATSTMYVEISKPIPAHLTDGLYGVHVPYVTPAAIVPDIPAIDIIKFLTFYFGCVCTYDEYSNTVTLNLIDKITTSEDWSAYFVSFSSDYNLGLGTNNYVRTKEPLEANLLDFNRKQRVMYGGGNVDTDYNNILETDLYMIPFAPAEDKNLSAVLQWAMPFIKFYDLKDDTTVTMTFTTVSSGTGGLARFNGTHSFIAQDMVRVQSTDGNYIGFGIVSLVSAGAWIELYGVLFTVTDAGSAIKTKPSPVTGPNRILYNLPGYSIANCGAVSSYNFVYANGLTSVNSSTAAVSFFDKPKINYTIDEVKQSLAVDTITGKEYNNTIGEQYYSRIRKIFNRPRLKCKMVIPMGVFAKFAFDRMIFLKTKDLSGYFLVDSIVNYVDSSTPVEVNLYMI